MKASPVFPGIEKPWFGKIELNSELKYPNSENDRMMAVLSISNDGTHQDYDTFEPLLVKKNPKSKTGTLAISMATWHSDFKLLGYPVLFVKDESYRTSQPTFVFNSQCRDWNELIEPGQQKAMLELAETLTDRENNSYQLKSIGNALKETIAHYVTNSTDRANALWPFVQKIRF